MGSLMLLKKLSLLFLLISVSLLSTSYAGRRRFVDKLENVGVATTHEEKESNIHERLLRANTKDYGTYDPAPTFVKPPFKLIPN